MTNQRSPFLTQVLPVVMSRLFWRVTTSSPTPAVWPSPISSPSSATVPSLTRSALARALSSVTVVESPAIMRLDLPASTSFFQAT